MTLNLKPYEKYKLSKQPFVNEIPISWNELRFAEVTRMKSIQNTNKEELLSVFLNKGVVPYSSTNKRQVHKPSEDLSKYQLVEVGDLVLNNQQAWRGSVGVSKYRGIVSPAYYVFELLDNYNPEYVNYMIRDKAIVNQFVLASKGVGSIQRNLYYPYLKNIILPMPSKEEQDQIVKYLNNNIFNINKLVKAKKKQVLLLKEQKQAIIDSAITKGINKKSTMKYSGIEWIGNIPESWEVRRLKSVATLSPTISQLVNERSLDDKVVFLPMDKISSDGDIDNSEWRKIKDVKTGFTSFAKNDVVVAKITPCFENGKGACLDQLASDFGYGTTELIVLRASEKVEPKYLYYITRISQFRILGEKDMTGSAGQKRVPTSFVGNFTLGIPKREEQIQIIEYIEKKKVQIENVIQKIASEIELISEYKNSLISSVVMGKIDVRDIQINEEIDAMDTDESEKLEFGYECDSDLNEIEGDE